MQPANHKLWNTLGVITASLGKISAKMNIILEHVHFYTNHTSVSSLIPQVLLQSPHTNVSWTFQEISSVTDSYNSYIKSCWITMTIFNVFILVPPEVNNPELSQHAFIMSIKTEPNVSVIPYHPISRSVGRSVGQSVCLSVYLGEGQGWNGTMPLTWQQVDCRLTNRKFISPMYRNSNKVYKTKKKLSLSK